MGRNTLPTSEQGLPPVQGVDHVVAQRRCITGAYGWVDFDEGVRGDWEHDA